MAIVQLSQHFLETSLTQFRQNPSYLHSTNLARKLTILMDNPFNQEIILTFSLEGANYLIYFDKKIGLDHL